MLRVLIVDDDRNVRNFIKKVINWEKEGFIISGEAENGKKGLEIFQKINPDIIILDLEMSLMDGLEMMKKLIERKTNSKVVVLSCHDEFEYVKDAMKLGAFDYILKHKMEPDNLLGVMKNLKTTIYEEKNKVINKSEATGSGSENRSHENIRQNIEKSKLLIEVARGCGIPSEEIKLRLKSLGLGDSNFVVVSLELDYYNKFVKGKGDFDKELFSRDILALINKSFIINEKCVSAMLDMDYFLILVSVSRKRTSIFEIRKMIYDAVEGVQKNMLDQFGITVSAGVSDICTNSTSLPDFTKQSKVALENKFYKGVNKIIYFSEVLTIDNLTLVNFKIDELKANTHHREYAQRVLCDLFSSIAEAGVSPDKFQGIFYPIMNIMTSYISYLKLDMADVFETHHFIYDALNEFETLEDYKIWFYDLYQRINEIYDSQMKKRYRSEILKAIQFIETNYIHEISLEEISLYVNMSKTYFSQLFKKETGENFVTFLAKCRIEKAKELLRQEDLKIYSIAYSVGFQSHHYFANLFKEYEGMTPNQYRQTVIIK